MIHLRLKHFVNFATQVLVNQTKLHYFHYI